MGTFPRDYRLFETKSSLNPALAFAMNKLGELDEKDRVLDPCCGTGTILIERQLLTPPALGVGVDIDPRALEKAQANAQKAGVEIKFKHGDIQEQKFPEGYFTKVISNLPYGINSGSREKNIKLYRFLAQTLPQWLKKNGKIVLITSSGNLLWNSFAKVESLKFMEKVAIPEDHLKRNIYIYQKI